MRRESKKENRKFLCTFFWREKKWRLIAQVSRTSDHDSSVCRANSFALQDESSKCRFPRSALQTSPYDDCIKTKICTTCTYYREILSLRALRSGRTIEYCVLLNLRTIEKRRLDLNWKGNPLTLTFATERKNFFRVDMVVCQREHEQPQRQRKKGRPGDWADLTAIYVLVVQWCTVRWWRIKICLRRQPASGNRAFRAHADAIREDMCT